MLAIVGGERRGHRRPGLEGDRHDDPVRQRAADRQPVAPRPDAGADDLRARPGQHAGRLGRRPRVARPARTPTRTTARWRRSATSSTGWSTSTTSSSRGTRSSTSATPTTRSGTRSASSTGSTSRPRSATRVHAELMVGLALLITQSLGTNKQPGRAVPARRPRPLPRDLPRVHDLGRGDRVPHRRRPLQAEQHLRRLRPRPLPRAPARDGQHAHRLLRARRRDPADEARARRPVHRARSSRRR